MGKAIRSNKPIGQGRLGYDLRATRAMVNTVRLLRFFIRVIGTGFRVDMHSQQLYMESIEMGFMRDKVHKIGKLRMHKLVPVGTNVGKYEKGFYFNPENVLHSKILRPSLYISAHNVRITRCEDIDLVCFNQDTSGHAPEIVPLSGGRYSLLPAGVCDGIN